ncbi:RHS repeat-associated core domain-containing protein, partial [Leptospira alstonii]|uniref:RHS repeat-associated core domain-containing protein n=1 Tax=Leptospira alstonii TaxID=28452 RepID=UPI000772F6F6
SVQMITDGAGNPASGPEPGVSYVSYEPYGSINRNDSYGPDIFRYKFTGQIEDKDTGLYYYKSRYYEPILGRFLQADSVVMPTNVNGMNRYMYVDGNPVSYRDPSGHVSGAGLMHMVNRIVGHAMGKDFGSHGINKIGHNISHGVNKFSIKPFTKLGVGRLKIKGDFGKFLDSTLGKNGVLGVGAKYLSPSSWLKPVVKHNAKHIIRTAAQGGAEGWIIFKSIDTALHPDHKEENDQFISDILIGYAQIWLIAPAFASAIAGTAANNIALNFLQLHKPSQ